MKVPEVQIYTCSCSGDNVEVTVSLLQTLHQKCGNKMVTGSVLIQDMLAHLVKTSATNAVY